VTPEAEVLWAAHTLTTLIEAEPSSHQAQRDRDLRGPFRKIQRLARRRFRAQRKSVLDSHALRNLGALREAEDPERTALELNIISSLSLMVYAHPVTAEEQQAYADAITKAIDSGSAAAADMLDVAVPETTESFIAEYLKDGGFTRLTGDLDKTTVDRLAAAVADAYEAGADFDGIVQAVKDSFADADSFRAGMIAQTELNDAWNQSLVHFAEQAGATKKAWITDMEPCIICIANALDGSIDMSENFASGDDAPPSHPNCLCSLMVSA